MKKIINNFLSIGVASIIGQFITFLTVAYYASTLGKESFGLITLAQQILLYFSTIVLFGLQTYGTRYISCNLKKKEEILGNIIVFRLLIASISFILILILSKFSNKGSEFANILNLFALTLFPTALNIDWFYNGIEKMNHNAIYTLIKNIVPSILIILIMSREKNQLIIPIATAIGLTLAFIYQFYILKIKYNVKIKFSLNFANIKNYAVIGFPFLASGVLSMINNNSDKLIIGFTRSDGELGIYQAAYVFISFFINIEGLLFTPVFPSLSKYYFDKNFNELKNICNFTSKIIIMIAVPIFIGGILLSKDIILLFYANKEYEDAYIPLMILLVYIFVLFIREIYAYQLNAWGYEKYYLKVIFISSIGNLCLNIFLTPIYGYVAAAIITTATELINLFYMGRKTRKIVRTKEFINILRVLPMAVIMGILIMIMKIFKVNVLVNVVISAVVYLGLIFKLEYIDFKYIKEIKN